MVLQDLRRVLQPPEHPDETTGDLSWNDIEDILSTPLPDDYKAFIATYGTGVIGNFMWIYNPFTKNKYLNLVLRVQKELNDLRFVRETMPEIWDYSYAIFPEENGIFPCGVTDNGEIIFWQVNGPPDQWAIVLFHTRYSEHEAFPISLTHYLEHLATGKITSTLFPSWRFLNRFQTLSEYQQSR